MLFPPAGARTHRRPTCNARIPLSLLLILSLILLSASAGCGDANDEQSTSEFLKDKSAPQNGYRVVESYDHDPANFTEGLDLEGEILYEGTGLYGQSRLIKRNLASGEILGSINVGSEYFAEGVTVLKGEVFQATYTSRICFVYDAETLASRRTFNYATEGWGLTDDGGALIMSDGSSNMYFMDPSTGRVEKTLEVRDDQGPVGSLNELEYVDGQIYANIWKTDVIAIISATSGEVEGWVDLTGLKPSENEQADVLNGIAFDTQTGYLLVTGKRWPYLYKIELVPR